jgi:hypothetical protein
MAKVWQPIRIRFTECGQGRDQADRIDTDNDHLADKTHNLFGIILHVEKFGVLACASPVAGDAPDILAVVVIDVELGAGAAAADLLVVVRVARDKYRAGKRFARCKPRLLR